MYFFKDKSVMEEYNLKVVAEKIGIHPDTLRKTINAKKPCSKLVAYCITKFLNGEKEIEDYFERDD